MIERDYDALVLDLDGTLLDETSRIHADNLAALREAVQRGVRVMVATGRSVLSAMPVLDELALDSLAVVFNGAGVYCPARRRLIEERVLSARTLARTLQFGREHGHLMVAMCADRKYAMAPRNAWEEAALSGMTGVEVASTPLEEVQFVIRVTLFAEHTNSMLFAGELDRAVAQPMYVTHFPLNLLPTHRASPLHVLDVHAPCRGKAEAMRVLQDQYGIPAERVVAVGDATNDVPMLEVAGLAVAMEDGMEEARLAADRIIGGHNTRSIAELVDELFLSRAAPPTSVRPA